MKAKNMRRICAGALAGIMILSVLLSTISASAAELPVSYSETYYATLDYYGAVSDASVVKSYRTNGQRTITDYGTYTSVSNLSSGQKPTISENKVIFNLGEAVPEKFYFEGKTTQPYEDLPWTISISYRLNGLPIQAEKLAGEKGLVEIILDVVPNPKASQYNRNNLVLTAATTFSDDDITAIEAEGAQVQLMGNLWAVMYMVMPGEEKQFTIRVGSNDFSFGGMILMAVPATLDQMEKIADIKEAKEDAEDSLDAMNESMDVILNTLEGMTGSLNATANGIDKFNSARRTMTAEKDTVKVSADAALDGLDPLTNSVAALDRYSDVTSQAIDDLTAVMNDMNDTAQSMAPDLETARALVVKLQKDTKELSDMLTDVEGYSTKAIRITSSMADILDDMDISMGALRWDLDRMESALRSSKGLSAISTSDMLGMLPEADRAKMQEVLNLHSQYEDYLKENGLKESQLSFEDYIIGGAYQQFCEQTVKDGVEKAAPAAIENAVQDFATANGREPTEDELAGIKEQVISQITEQVKTQLPTLENFVKADAAKPYVEQAKQAAAAYDEFSTQLPMVDTINKKIKEVNSLITGLTVPTANLVEEMSDLCGELGDTGLTDDMASMLAMCRDLLKTMKEYEGVGQTAMEHMDEMGDLVSKLTKTMDTLLTEIDSMIGLVNAYTPDLHSAIDDIAVVSSSLQSTLRDTTAAMTAARELLRKVEPDMESGAELSLNGLGDMLRRATNGLNETGTIRNAKDTIKDLIDDQWDEHSGEVDGLLNMDASATPESMTDSRNGTPMNVQYIMRTQEIKENDDDGDDTATAETADNRTIWQRIADMFVDIWRSITSLFSKGEQQADG